MLKTLLIFFLGLLVFQGAKGQSKKVSDTLVLYLDNTGRLAHKDYATQIMLILPPDTSTTKPLYPVIQYDMDGKPTKTGISTTKDYLALSYEGPVTFYYTNGNKQRVENYVGGYQIGDVLRYYPNGQLYSLEKNNDLGKHFLIACYDTTGTQLAQNGNGQWIKFDNSTSQEIERGMVKDSLEDGVWQETYYKTLNYTATYVKGIVVASTDPNRYLGGDAVFTAVEQPPRFNGDFGTFLAKTVNYPAHDKENNIQGRVILTFVVEKDGSLSDIRVLRSPDQTLGDEAMRVLKLSSWVPGTQNGQAVRVQYTIPISFSLGDGN